MTDLPYGLWRRVAPRADLDPWERRERDADESWDLRHSEEADRLDALIGQTVRLLKRRQGFPDPETGEGRVFPKGSRFKVRGRVRNVLLVDSPDDGPPLLLQADWIEVVGR